MAGSKHDRSGASGGGEASPLAAQLQQAWMHTQMPKTPKRSLVSAPNSNNNQQQKNSSDHHPSSPHNNASAASPTTELQSSAFKSLSSLFPELAALPQEKKPMISSVFRDGEYPNPRPRGGGSRDSDSCPFFDGAANFGADSAPPPTPGAAAAAASSQQQQQHLALPPHRKSFSASPVAVQQSSNSLEHLPPAFRSSHSFSGIRNNNNNNSGNGNGSNSSNSDSNNGNSSNSNHGNSSNSNHSNHGNSSNSNHSNHGNSSNSNHGNHGNSSNSNHGNSSNSSGSWSMSPGVSTFSDGAYSSDYNMGSSAVVASEFETPDPADANTLYSYLNNLLDDELEYNKCMFVECSAYQAMAKELGDLIGDADYSSAATTPFDDHIKPLEKDPDVERWLEDILSGPLPAEVPEHQQGLKEINNHSSIKSFAYEDDAAAAPQQMFDSGMVQHNNNIDSNGVSWADGSTEMMMMMDVVGPEGAAAAAAGAGAGDGAHGALTSISPYNHRDSVSYSELSDAAVDHDALVPQVAVLPQLSKGHHIPQVDLQHLLLRCAQAVEQNDVLHGSELIEELRQHSSPNGNGQQRTAHYFTEALVARMSGTGGKLYTALKNNRPSAPEMLKAYRLFVECCPFIRVSHLFANLAIMNAIGDAKRLHIVDYGILYGVQWPCFIYHLSKLPGGPHHLRITGIDLPQPGFRPSERIQETGRRLACVAEHVGVPFEFHAIAEKWEAITPAHLFLRNDEVLAVNCVFRLRHLLDESVMAASPRDLVLNRIRSMNPKIFVEAVVNGAYNAPFFMSRFRQALTHYSTVFEVFDASMPAEDPDRVIAEQEMFGRQILNIVACEGLERVERAEPYKQWQARTLRAGFTQLPIMEFTRAKIRSIMRNFHRDYGIGEDGAWFLSGWKDKILQAFSIWQPLPTSP